MGIQVSRDVAPASLALPAFLLSLIFLFALAFFALLPLQFVISLPLFPIGFIPAGLSFSGLPLKRNICVQLLKTALRLLFTSPCESYESTPQEGDEDQLMHGAEPLEELDISSR